MFGETGKKTKEKKQTILEMINNINKKSPKFAKQKKKQQTNKKKYKKSLKSYAKVYASIKRKIKGKSKKVQNIQNGLKKS